MKTLTVIAVVPLKDKNKNDYNKILLSQPATVMQGGRSIRVEPKTQNIVKWPKSYLPGNDPQYGHDLKEGELVAGDIVTRAGLFPYPIVDESTNETRMATKASHVVFGNSDDTAVFESAIDAEFHSRGKFVATEANIAAYTKFWGANPDTGEIVATKEVEAEGAVL